MFRLSDQALLGIVVEMPAVQGAYAVAVPSKYVAKLLEDNNVPFSVSSGETK